MIDPIKAQVPLHPGKAPLRIVVMLFITLFFVFATFLTLKVFQGPTLPARLHTTAALLFNKKMITSADTVKIMPLGDSITFGVNSTDLGGYRVTLWNECESAGWPVSFVGSVSSGPPDLPDQENEGHPGWRIDQLSAHIIAWLQTYQPQIVLLQIGTNDIIQNHEVDTAPARLNDLVTQITTLLPRTTVIVAQITPLGFPRLNPEVITYDRTIPPMVRLMDARGKHVDYVNMYNAIPLQDISDHIHPNDTGYAMMAHVWFTGLASVMHSYTHA